MRIIKSIFPKIFCAKLFCVLAFSLLLSSCASQITRPTAPTKVVTIPMTPPQATVPTKPATQKIIQKKVKVAALLPLSGKSKDLGTAMLNSVILSLFENDQNNDIELVVLDSADIKKSANEIISQKIKIVIGPIFSTDVEAFHDIVKNQQITILSFSNNQDLANKRNVFLMGFLPEQQIERITSYAIANGKENFAIIAPSNQYGQKFSEIFKEMVKRKDGNLVASELYLNSSKDLEKAISKAINSYLVSPDARGLRKKNLQEEDKFYANVILVPESGPALAKIVNLVNRYNVSEREIQIVGSSNWDDISTLNDPNLIGGWFTSSDPIPYRDFEKRYYQIYNKFPPRISTIAYDATLAAIETVRKSSRRDVISEDFINYKSLKNGYVGIDGLFRFLPNGIVQRNFAILEVKNGRFEMIDSPSSMFFKY